MPCYNGHAIDDETLQFSSVRHLTHVPDDSKVAREHVNYSSHWSSDGNSLTVHRELTTHFDTPLCSGSEKDELVALGLVLAGRDAVTGFFALDGEHFSEAPRSAIPLAWLTIPASRRFSMTAWPIAPDTTESSQPVVGQSIFSKLLKPFQHESRNKLPKHH